MVLKGIYAKQKHHGPVHLEVTILRATSQVLTGGERVNERYQIDSVHAVAHVSTVAICTKVWSLA